MDVHCTTCNEPWDTYHLWHDAIHETSLSTEEAKAWGTLPKQQKLTPHYRALFKEAKYEFGNSVINVIRCPSCKPHHKADSETLAAKACLEAMLDGDEDGLAAMYEDYNL